MPAEGEEQEAAPAKRKSTRRVIKEEELVTSQAGLNNFYYQAVIRGGKEGNLKLKGKGHEVSDLANIMKMYHNWHESLAPRYDFKYFAERVSSFSEKKGIRAHMSKLRSVYKGEEDLFIEFNGE